MANSLKRGEQHFVFAARDLFHRRFAHSLIPSLLRYTGMRALIPSLFILLGLAAAPLNAQTSSAWRYQGTLNERGTTFSGAVAIRVTPYASEAGGKPLAPAITYPNVQIRAGQFELHMDLPLLAIAEPWLGVEILAGDGEASALPTRSRLAKNAGAACWALNGNAGTTPGTDFLGTTDLTRMALRAGNLTFLSGESRFVADGGGVLQRAAPVVIAGSGGNSVASGVVGAAIGGGGGNNPGVIHNRVTDDWGVVAGGGDNIAGNSNAPTNDGTFATVGGGFNNEARAGGSVVGGGNGNVSSGIAAAIAGGFVNTASGQAAAIGGGFGNEATGESSAIGGGQSNEATGTYATVPGGTGNRALAPNSMASGTLANVRATDRGSFVWSDASPGGFQSSAQNQFLVRATGGVGINTSETQLGGVTVGNPSNTNALVSLGWSDGIARLRVGGSGNGSVNGFVLQSVSDQILLRAVDAGATARVGIGRNPTTYALEVQGEAFKTAGGGSWLTPSDERVKTDVQALHGALERLSALRPVSFHYTPEYLRAHPGASADRQVSVIAQDYAKIYPEAVHSAAEPVPGADKGAPNLLLVDLHPALIDSLSAVARLAAQNALLEGEVKALRGAIGKINERLNQIDRGAK